MGFPSRFSFSVGLGDLLHRIRRRGLGGWLQAAWDVFFGPWDGPPVDVPVVEDERPTQATRPDWIAVIVGINRYMGDGRNNLSGCRTDAERLAARYRKAGWTVVLLLDYEATKSAVVTALRKAIAATKYGGRLTFSFSGHGSLTPDPADPDGEAEALCCTDCLEGGSLTFVERCLSVVELARLVYGHPDFLAFLDACHTGILEADAGYLNTVRGLFAKPRPIQIPRFLPPPLELVRNGARQLFAARGERQLVSVAGFDRTILAGCLPSGTCSDTVIGGVPCGAWTAHFLAAFDRDPRADVATLTEAAVKSLHRDAYEQTPVATGSAIRLARRAPWAEVA